MSKQREDIKFEWARDIDILQDADGKPVGYVVGKPYKLDDKDRIPPGVAVPVEDDE